MDSSMQKGSSAFLAFPDPILTANLYCSGRLTEAVSEVLVPFRHELATLDQDELSYLWFMRYGRRGEHLKVRLHGPDSLIVAQSSLERAASSYFRRLDGAPPDEHRRNYVYTPPLDAEDRDAEDHPDRKLLWTHYFRNSVPLGFGPLLTDDHYVALFTRCLGQGTDVALNHFARVHSSGRLSYQDIQNLYLKFLMTGLTASGFTEEQSISYLLYHRDSLLRAVLRSSQLGKAKLKEIFSLFRGRLDAMAPQIDSIHHSMEQIWNNSSGLQMSLRLNAWCISVEKCLAYVNSLDSPKLTQVDPFDRKISHSILFKILHLHANQLGIDQLNEAMSCQIILSAVSSGSLNETDFSWTPPALSSAQVG